MPREERLTFWFPVDPEGDRRRLIDHATRSVRSVNYDVERAEKMLAAQGYRIHPEDVGALTAMVERFEERLRKAITRARIEHVGPPQGKVAPPEVEAAYAANPHRKHAVVTKDEEPTGPESRSRH